MELTQQYNVLEFYSGIGGMHYALEETNIPHKVIGAIDINTSANHVYKHNFPETRIMQRNIESIDANELEKLNADVWTLSPPCQPYSRLGNQNHSNDPRSNSFMKILDALVKMKNPPKFIFLENVKGFEESDTRHLLIQSLLKRNYFYQEMLVSPKHIGIPNSRLRYFLACKLEPFKFETTNSIYEVREARDSQLDEIIHPDWSKMMTIGHMIDEVIEPDKTTYRLDKKKLLRFYPIFDIVTRESENSCCFTKGYSQLVKGAGSVFSPLSKQQIDDIYEKISMPDTSDEEIPDLLENLELRHFTPLEASHIMGFPKSFSFPEDVTLKQKYQLIGNSVCVKVVTKLLKNVLFEM